VPIGKTAVGLLGLINGAVVRLLYTGLAVLWLVAGRLWGLSLTAPNHAVDPGAADTATAPLMRKPFGRLRGNASGERSTRSVQ
jgi:hypothetical protein